MIEVGDEHLEEIRRACGERLSGRESRMIVDLGSLVRARFDVPSDTVGEQRYTASG